MRRTRTPFWLWYPGLLSPLSAWLTYRVFVSAVAAKGNIMAVLEAPPFWLVVSGIASIITTGLLLGKIEEALHQPSIQRGSAHWASGRELKFYTAKRGESALTLGKAYGRRIAISVKRMYEHVAIVATTGKGETSKFFIPWLLSERGDRSVFTLDAKSELTRETAGALSERLPVWLFDPDHPEACHTYNPLAHIHGFNDAVDFARSWVDNTGRSVETFWPNMCQQLIAGAVLHLRATEPAAPLYRLAEVLGGLSLDQLETLFEASPSEQARGLGAQAIAWMRRNDKLIGSMLVDLNNRLMILHSPEIRQVTRTNEMDFARMGQEPIALYFCVPPGAMERLRPLACSFMLQMFTTWIRMASQQPDGALSVPVVCYLDEFGTVGTIPHMGEYMATLRSRRVALIYAIQDFQQLEALYEKADETILSNASTHIVLPGVGLREAKYYSERIGETTIVTVSHSYRSNWGEATTQRSESSRRLIKPEEIRTMRDGEALVLVDVTAPLLVKVKPYYRIRHLARRARLPFTLRPISESVSRPASVSPVMQLLPQPQPQGQSHQSPD